jgi:hypothetical protein
MINIIAELMKPEAGLFVGAIYITLLLYIMYKEENL